MRRTPSSWPGSHAAVLGWTVKDEATSDAGTWALIESPAGELKMEFQGADDYTPPVWPNAPGQQQMMMHIDVAVEVIGGERDPRERFSEFVDHVVSLGGRVAEHQPQEDRVVVMLDPAGHPFCLFPTPVRSA